MASISAGSNVNTGMSGWPDTMPSASDSARSSTGYRFTTSRNGGAFGCGLSPVVSIA